MTKTVRVIAIDGPSGAGKGTVAKLLADKLNYHLLDSGAVYRAAGLHCLNNGADLSDEASVMRCLGTMQAVFVPRPGGVCVRLSGVDVSNELRSEATATAASKVAVMPRVRASLLDEQRSFRISPGLVADGRDMGTVVFPDADIKVFLSASVQVRANRRAKQLKDKGLEVNMAGLLQEIAARDDRDSSRQHAPLIVAEDALVIDSSDISAENVAEQILQALTADVG